jgi:hypothetical protein
VLGGVVLGLGAAMTFLSTDFAGPLWLALTVAVLPLVSRTWRTPAHAVTAAVALVVALPLAAAWPYALAQRSPELFSAWLAANDWRALFAPAAGSSFDPLYVAKNLPWFAWPAVPLALWMLWIRGRGFNGGLRDAGVVLPGVLAIVVFAMLSLQRDPKLIAVMPLLVPLALLASLEVDSMKRGFSGALDWFGILTFGLAAMLVWGHLDRLVRARHVARHRPDVPRHRDRLPADLQAVGDVRGARHDDLLDRDGAAGAPQQPARGAQLGDRRHAAVGARVDDLAAVPRLAPQLPRRRRVDPHPAPRRRLRREPQPRRRAARVVRVLRGLEDRARGIRPRRRLRAAARAARPRGHRCAAPAGMRAIWEGQRRGDATEKFVLYRRGPA